MSKTEERDQLLETLCQLHEVHISFGSEDVHVYRVTQFALKELMTSVVSGDQVVSFPSLQVGGEYGEWEESFTTVNMAVINWIEWPERVIREMHDAMSSEVESIVDDILSEKYAEEDGDEGEA